jgi:hypothetical protein
MAARRTGSGTTSPLANDPGAKSADIYAGSCSFSTNAEKA